MSTVLEKMRARIEQARVRRANMTDEEKEYEHQQERKFVLETCYLDPDMDMETGQEDFVYTIFNIRHGCDLELEDYLPVFVCPIEVAQSTTELMWNSVKLVAVEDQVDDEFYYLFALIVTLIHLREPEWTEEYREFRLQDSLTNFELFFDVDESSNPRAWKDENITEDTPPEWWVCDRLNQLSPDENRHIERHFSDLWIWEDASDLNRLLWEYAREQKDDPRVERFTNEKLIRYFKDHKRING